MGSIRPSWSEASADADKTKDYYNKLTDRQKDHDGTAPTGLELTLPETIPEVMLAGFRGQLTYLGPYVGI